MCNSVYIYSMALYYDNVTAVHMHESDVDVILSTKQANCQNPEGRPGEDSSTHDQQEHWRGSLAR